MKIKKLIGLSALTGVFAIGAAVGLNVNNIKRVDAVYSQGDVIDKGKARVWIGYDTSNPFYSYADETTGIRLWIHSTSSGGSENVYGSITGTFNNGAQSSRRYDYFDINLADYTNGWYMTVQKFQGGNWKAQTNPIQLSSSNTCQVYFVWGDWAWDQTAGTVAAGSIDSVDAGLAAKALGGIQTCSSSNINGYNAFSNYNSTFVKNGNTWKTVGNMSDYTLNDYANGDTSYSGTKSNTINAYDKYEMVEALYSNNGNLSRVSNTVLMDNENSAMITIVITTSVIALTAIGGYFFFRKRKEN